jgi:hypothetical protein
MACSYAHIIRIAVSASISGDVSQQVQCYKDLTEAIIFGYALVSRESQRSAQRVQLQHSLQHLN